ncbi:beta-1,3-galactosyltransferase 2-like [Latimeria chalumnae]|uniref:beta-1,3-galactosyltransferase 2-like n=1 Tax=Latimeria chalumnae TaxID=7897 RepID=UPI00313F1AC2
MCCVLHNITSRRRLPLPEEILVELEEQPDVAEDEERRAEPNHRLSQSCIHYNYFINEPDKCKNKNPFLVLLIPTGPTEIHARNVIRETWGNETLIPGVTIIRLFFIGLPVTILEALQKQLEEESSVHHDIIQRDFLDIYSNLTIKTMTSLEWLADFCPEADYAMKVDADMFLNIEKLVKSLLKPDIPTRKNYFTGAPFIKARPIRDKNSKWYMPESVFPGQEYAPFCSGTGYVFSVNIVWKILEASYIVKPVYLEDVYIGLCLNFAQITITIPLGSFFNIGHVDYEACRYRNLITSHYFNPDHLLRTWTNFQEKRVYCPGA